MLPIWTLVLMPFLVGQDPVRWPNRARASEAAHNVVQARRDQDDDSRAVEGKEGRRLDITPWYGAHSVWIRRAHCRAGRLG